MKTQCSTIDARAFGLAAGTTGAALSALCALALAVWPEGTRAALGFLIHSDISGLRVAVSLAGAVISTLAWGVIVGVVFGGAAALYNRFVTSLAGERAVGAMPTRA